MSISTATLVALLAAGGLAPGQTAGPEPADRSTGHPRLVVLTDIGNEPDDQMSLTRLLLYSNQIDIEALVATTSTWQKNAVHPELARALIAAYGRVRPNLLAHASGWPTEEDLQ